ncbi:MAG TPA: TetR/AcrR family transcriptional regulator [Actinomycetota bacterium]|nr:TetR/AcrR family transcriptional regulator [Actinomycetota bacterium]
MPASPVSRVTAPADALTKGERTKLRLLEAAEEIFGRDGYHAASIADLTREAEVAMGTFYVYFTSKQECLIELVNARGHELRTELREATQGLASRAEIERAGFATFLAWVRRHPDIYRVVRNAEFVDREVFRQWYRKLGQSYVRGLRQSMDAGNIDHADPEALAYCLMAVADFTGMRWVLWEDGAQVPKRVFDTVMQFVLRGLGAEPADGDCAKGNGRSNGARLQQRERASGNGAQRRR